MASNATDFAIPIVVQILSAADFAERSRVLRIASKSLNIPSKQLVSACEENDVKLPSAADQNPLSDDYPFLRRMSRQSLLSGFFAGGSAMFLGVWQGVMWGVFAACFFAFQDLLREDKVTGRKDGWWWKKSLNLAITVASNETLMDELQNAE